MRIRSWLLSAWLAFLAVDALLGWPIFRELVEKLVRVWCTVAGPAWDRDQCTARLFYSRRLWALVAAASAAAAWVVTGDVLKYRRLA